MSTDTHPTDWNRLEQRVRERDGHRCQHCDRDSGRYGRVDLRVRHVVPRSRGGSDHPRNLVTLCRKCHEAASEHHVIGSEDRISQEVVGTSTDRSGGRAGGAFALVVGGILLPAMATLLVLML